jgi:hypothetical protein
MINTRTGFIQMVNMPSFSWHAKKQESIEGATFSSEFVAMRAAVEANRTLRHKL